MTEPGSQQRVILGRVVGLFGVKGWIKVYSETEPPAGILAYSPWYLKLAGGWQPFELVQGRHHGKGLIASLAGCTNRDEAAPLLGATIAVGREQLPELAENEYYWADLVGLKVVNSAGETLGTVDHLLETGANDVLVVRTENGQEWLIPYVEGDVVQAIDLDKGCLRVDWNPDF